MPLHKNSLHLFSDRVCWCVAFRLKNLTWVRNSISTFVNVYVPGQPPSVLVELAQTDCVECVTFMCQLIR